MDTRVYVCTHREYTPPKDAMYRTIHVGKAIGQQLDYEGDNTGDNISEKNKNFCELTGVYWIWKNVQCDVVGICHYRRYFVNNDVLLDEAFVENVLKSYDVILPVSSYTKSANLKEQYAQIHYMNDMDVCRQVVAEKYPDYLDAFDTCMSCNFFSVGNMLITRKEIFDEYCEWLFDILFEVERRVDISNYDTNQARLFGYLSERLLRIWFLNKNYRIKEYPVKMIDPKDYDEAHNVVGLKKRYVSVVLNNMIEQYRAGTRPLPVNSEAARIDFGGRIPVWTFWAQGEATAPEVVKKCIDSMRRNLPPDLVDFRFVSADNMGQYISLPIWIVERFGQGRITLQHLADIVRAGVMYRYGGLWINPSCFVAGKPDDKWINSDFFTRQCRRDTMDVDVSQGRWDMDIIKCSAGNEVFRLLLDAYYEYWKLCDNMIDPDLTDYILDAAYANLDFVRTAIDGCATTKEAAGANSVNAEPNMYMLNELLSRKYNCDKFKELTADTTFFKLNYKENYLSENIVGQETFYGHIFSKRG